MNINKFKYFSGDAHSVSIEVLDFAGVQIVDNSFADECLAKILLVMPLEELKKRKTFAGLNELAQKNIVIASRRRIKALESAA